MNRIIICFGLGEFFCSPLSRIYLHFRKEDGIHLKKLQAGLYLEFKLAQVVVR